MKNLLKQPFLWIGLLFVLLCAGVCVVAPKFHYSYGIVNKYEKAVNKNDIAGLVSLYAPEDREEIRAYLALFDGVLGDMDLGADLYVGKMVTEEDDEDAEAEADASKEQECSIPVIKVRKDGDETDISTDSIDLKKVNGKLYLED